MPGTWDDGVTLAYQWTADGTDIPSATTSAYTPVAGDVGKVISVKVTGSQGRLRHGHQGVGPDHRRLRRRARQHPDADRQRYAEGGRAADRDAGIWDDGVALAYQWTADGTNIAGATTPAYTPVAGDVDKVISVKVTGSKAGFTSVTKESAATAAVAKGDLAATPTPTISGTTMFGEASARPPARGTPARHSPTAGRWPEARSGRRR